MNLEAQIKKLHRAVRTLKSDQGAVARRNARARVRAAVRIFTKALDKEFPRLATTPKKKRKQFLQRLERKPWPRYTLTDKELKTLLRLKLPMKLPQKDWVAARRSWRQRRAIETTWLLKHSQPEKGSTY